MTPEASQAVRLAYQVIHEPFGELDSEDEVVEEVQRRLVTKP